jgi:hypothetical protein
MPEDRPLFTYRLELDELYRNIAVYALGGSGEDERQVRLSIPREDWESIERLGDVQIELRAVRPPGTA